MKAGPRSRPGRTRGLSLVEMLVVMAIGMTVMLVLLPITIGLLREGQALSTEILTSEALPHLHERLAQDLLAAGGAGIIPFPFDGSPVVRLTLTPPLPADPIVIYDFEPTLIRRTVQSPDPKIPPPARPQSWRVPGSVSVPQDELVAGRFGLLYRPAGGEAELLVFALPGTLPGVRERP
jgi:hypothetical protein